MTDPFSELFDERFLSKADQDGPIAPTLGTRCWIWTAADNGAYGVYWFELGVGPQGYAHRFAWQVANGQTIPEGLTIDHLCKRTLCVNPAHLELVTMAENILRGDSPMAINARKTHCPKGHPYDSGNTRVRNGSRFCKECDRSSHREKARAEGARPIGSFRPHNTKLTEEDVRVIRRRYAAGEISQSQLAREFEVAQTLVSAIVRRRIWDDVP